MKSPRCLKPATHACICWRRGRACLSVPPSQTPAPLVRCCGFDMRCLRNRCIFIIVVVSVKESHRLAVLFGEGGDGEEEVREGLFWYANTLLLRLPTRVASIVHRCRITECLGMSSTSHSRGFSMSCVDRCARSVDARLPILA